MTDHPTPGSPLSADDVGLLKRGDALRLSDSFRPGHFAIHADGLTTVEDVDAEDDTVVLRTSGGQIDYFSFSTMVGLFDFVSRLPTDRRAEAEVGKKHGPKCWGRTSYSDEMAHCYCADTPPSAGPDAGLETVAKLQSSDIFWTDAGLKLPLPAAGEEIEFVTRQSAAAALEAAAEREGELRFQVSAVEDQMQSSIQYFNDRATRAEAQVADRDKRIAELARHLTGMLDAYELLCQQSGMNYHESPSSKYAAARQALSAIPTPGRSE